MTYPNRWRRLSVFLLRGGLLVVVLIAANVVVDRWAPAHWDLTAARTFTLDARTVEVLSDIDEPVVVTFLAAAEQRTLADRSFAQATSMLEESLDLYRQHHHRITVRRIDPEADFGEQLQREYPDIRVPAVVITCGAGTGKRHEVLSHRDLIRLRGERGGGIGEIEFYGEQALTAALVRLADHRPQMIVTCLTGHGELSLADDHPQSARGLGILAERMRSLDIAFRPLRLTGQTGIPSETDVLLIAGPQNPLDADEITALRSYFKHGGRALVLFDRADTSGLFSLMQEYGVLVGRDRVFMRSGTRESSPAVTAEFAGGQHTFAQVADGGLFHNARSVRMLPPVAGRKTETAPLLVSPAFPRAWAEAETSSQSQRAVSATEILKGPIGLAAAVERKTVGETEAVLVVVGNAEFASNRGLTADVQDRNIPFLLSSLVWLQGRKDRMQDISIRHRRPYVLAGSPSDSRSLPWKAGLILAALLVTAGATVWTTRTSSD